MKQLFAILFSLLAITTFSQDITNKLGGDGTGNSNFLIQNSADPVKDVFTVRDDGGIIGTGSMVMPIHVIQSTELVDGVYTATAGDYTLIADASNPPDGLGSFTILVPAILAYSGTLLNVKVIDISGNNTVTVTDANDPPNTVILNSRESLMLQYYYEEGSSLSGWYILGHYDGSAN